MKSDVLKTFAQKAKRRLVGKECVSNAKIKVIKNEDEDFAQKVNFLLSKREVISNPAQYLMDEKVLHGLGEIQREKYLLDTLDKYNAMKRKLEATFSAAACD